MTNGGIGTDTLRITVMIVSCTIELINLKTLEVFLSCNKKTARILSVPVYWLLDPKKQKEFLSAAFFLTLSLTLWIGKVSWLLEVCQSWVLKVMGKCPGPPVFHCC